MAIAKQGTQVELYYATRLNNSVNGNPRFRLATSGGDFNTSSDASCSYDVENITRSIPNGGSVSVTLYLTKAGKVWNIIPA